LRPGIHFITNNIGAVHIAWPVAHRTIRILITHIKHQSPSALTLGVTILLMLTVSTLYQTSFSCGPALPESAAVCRVLVVVRLLGDGIHELGAVRDHASIIGETVLAGVVGHRVVWGGPLGPDQADQQ
jgi:hypothetical protein